MMKIGYQWFVRLNFYKNKITGLNFAHLLHMPVSR